MEHELEYLKVNKKTYKTIYCELSLVHNGYYTLEDIQGVAIDKMWIVFHNKRINITEDSFPEVWLSALELVNNDWHYQEALINDLPTKDELAEYRRDLCIEGE